MDKLTQAPESASLRDMPAFDAWMRQELREMFGATMLEPVPEELMALILS